MYLWSIAYFFSPISSSYYSPISIVHQNIHCSCFICKVIHKYKISYSTKLVQNFGRQQSLSCFLSSECLISYACSYIYVVKNSTLFIIAAFASFDKRKIDKKELIQYSLHFSSICLLCDQGCCLRAHLALPAWLRTVPSLQKQSPVSDSAQHLADMVIQPNSEDQTRSLQSHQGRSSLETI